MTDVRRLTFRNGSGAADPHPVVEISSKRRGSVSGVDTPDAVRTLGDCEVETAGQRERELPPAVVTERAGNADFAGLGIA